jgi:thiol:disulfide interchange protein DsbD
MTKAKIINYILLILIGILGLSSCSNKNQKQISIENDSSKVKQDSQLCESPSFANHFGFPASLKGYLDLDEGIECSKIVGKPCLIYFSGYSSVDSRRIEMNLFLDEEIQSLIDDQFVFVSLIKDAKMRLPVNYQVFSELINDTIKIYGEKSTYIQNSKFNSDEHPAFYIVNSDGEVLSKPFFYNLSIPDFNFFLEEGLSNY